MWWRPRLLLDCQGACEGLGILYYNLVDYQGGELLFKPLGHPVLWSSGTPPCRHHRGRCLERTISHVLGMAPPRHMCMQQYNQTSPHTGEAKMYDILAQCTTGHIVPAHLPYIDSTYILHRLPLVKECMHTNRTHCFSLQTEVLSICLNGKTHVPATAKLNACPNTSSEGFQASHHCWQPCAASRNALCPSFHAGQSQQQQLLCISSL